MSATLDERLDALLELAARDMDRLAGGAAVCTFTRAGVPVPGIKYAEGRWAALRELHRARRRSPDDGSLADGILGTWRDQLAALRERGAGPDWIAYRTGGVDALTELLEAAPDTAGTRSEP
ncbi:MAG: hypothetical protein GC157_00105 [Frankiales bacterium]|nr:hypothetical protein [Frankiales bacterium]